MEYNIHYERVERCTQKGDRHMDMAKAYESRRAYGDASEEYLNAFIDYTFAQASAKKINDQDAVEELESKKDLAKLGRREANAFFKAVVSDNPGFKQPHNNKSYREK